MKQGLCRCLQVTDYLAKQMCSQRGTEQNRRQQAPYWAHKQCKGKAEEKKKKIFMATSPSFGSIHHSGNYLPSVCFSLKKWIPGGEGYMQCFSVVLPAPSLRQISQRSSTWVSQGNTDPRASPRSPLTYLSEWVLSGNCGAVDSYSHQIGTKTRIPQSSWKAKRAQNNPWEGQMGRTAQSTWWNSHFTQSVEIAVGYLHRVVVKGYFPF